MKRIFWIKPIVFTSILLLITCKKEEPISSKEYSHWPVVRTLVATNIDSTKATLNGTVNGYGLSTTVTFEYGTTTDYGNIVTALQSPVTGDSVTHVSTDVSGLTSNTKYYFRVKADNSKWINFYGSDKIFYTGPHPHVTDVDGNIYHTIKIGSQVWMAENLKTTNYNDGTPLLNVTDGTAWVNLTAGTGAYCNYNNIPDNATTYGRLYNWSALWKTGNDGKNICPTGWHVPNDSDWTTLITYLGGDSVAGGLLKESGTIHWAAPNTGATDEFSFSALPGGWRYNGEYIDIGSTGIWWNSSPHGPGTGGFSMSFSSTKVSRDPSPYHLKGLGCSVRCVMD